MEILNTYCFEEIFHNLSLSDLLLLRTVSRRFKQEVDTHLLSLRSLPLYLTTPRTPEVIAAYENVIASRFIDCDMPKLDDSLYIRKLSFGTSGLKTFEDGTILQNQSHFRLADFYIINHSSELPKFLAFINKHCPNIEKLALVIDHCRHYLPEVPRILRAFPKIKILLVENTFQDSCRYDGRGSITPKSEIYDLRRQRRNRVKLIPEVYDSILELKDLEELYLFPKRQSQLCRRSDETGSREQNFVKTSLILCRLRVFHFNTYVSTRMFQLSADEAYVSIQELACARVDWLSQNRAEIEFPVFPELKKCTIFRDRIWWRDNAVRLLLGPNLEVLDIDLNFLMVNETTMGVLNSFPKLKRFHCCRLWLYLSLGDSPIMREEEEDEFEIVPKELKNRTIKHLQVIDGPETPERRKNAVRRYKKRFLALETCTFLEPEYSVVRASDLRKRALED